jgi:hypothetical protein
VKYECGTEAQHVEGLDLLAVVRHDGALDHLVHTVQGARAVDEIQLERRDEGHVPDLHVDRPRVGIALATRPNSLPPPI